CRYAYSACRTIQWCDPHRYRIYNLLRSVTMRGTSSAKLLAATASGLLLFPLAAATPASAAEIVTPYPAVAVEPGETTTFDLEITSDESELVELRVSEAPDGWETVLRGGGREVSAVFATPDEPGEVQLD